MMPAYPNRRLLNRRLFRLFVAVLVSAAPNFSPCFSAEKGRAEEEAAIPATDGPLLLQRIESANAEDVEKDREGKVAFVRLRQGWANDRNVTLVSEIESLRRLSLMPTETVQPTTFGIAALEALTNLVTLHVACSGPMRDGVFRGICKLRHLRTLWLVAAYPARPSEYDSITNLQDLTELHMTYCTNFTDAHLTLVTNLPNLRSIELKANALSTRATNILSGMKTLTNVALKPNGVDK